MRCKVNQKEKGAEKKRGSSKKLGEFAGLGRGDLAGTSLLVFSFCTLGVGWFFVHFFHIMWEEEPSSQASRSWDAKYQTSKRLDLRNYCLEGINSQ